MQKREIKRLDQRATAGQEKESTEAKHGQKSYSKKSGKVSSQSRKKGGRASAGKKQQRGQRQTAYKYTSEDVSRIVQRRTKELRDKLNDLKAENAVLKEVLITAFKDWFKEQKEEGEKGND